MLTALLSLSFLAAGQPKLLPTASDRTGTLHGPAAGHLVIIGGGEVPAEVWDCFCALAGGRDARIVVITNATGAKGAYTGPAFEEIGRRVARVTELHLEDIAEANDPSLTAPLEEADGIFFTGGRQWRISEVYLNTRAHAAMNALLARGGVIGGTSAGASIQGSFLWRGDTRGADILVGDHTQGLGFMKRTAIDQHMFVRKRESDLLPFIQAAPAYLGIGIDESTAVVVERDSLRVLGRSKVALYVPGQETFRVLEAGEACDLRQPLTAAAGTNSAHSVSAAPVSASADTKAAVSVPETAAPAPVDGYPVANFAVTANVSADGDLFGRILHNRGTLGSWLTDLGALRLSLVKGGTIYPLSSYAQRDVCRAFPFVTADLSGHEAIRSDIHYEVWAPLGLNDLDITALPVLQLELTFTNPSDEPETLTLRWRPDSLGKSPSHWRDYSAADLLQGQWGAQDGLASWPPVPSRTAEDAESAQNVAADDRAVPSAVSSAAPIAVSTAQPSSLPIVVPAGRSVTLRYALAFHDDRQYAAQRFPDAGAIRRYAFDHWTELKQATQAFEAKIPRTGDAELDDYLRWYMVPGVALTKCTAKGQVVTLGYCELNQRDSYWASWLHLVLMPTAERRMIEESIAGMRPHGKVPTCLLPRIDRKDDIDINAFFLLRFYRYYKYHGDDAFLKEHWAALQIAADWLLSRDLEGIGLPVQTSTWADWKDVSGVEGRKYSPYAALVYIAAMRRMSRMAEALGDTEAQERYGEAAGKAFRRINLPRGKGGLWNGRYYCQLWKDGRTDDRLLQDQTVGILLGVVPPGRARSIIRALNRTNRTPWGICETFPYYDADFGYAPATYHNGGVWPWLSFADDWARITLGRRQEAIGLVKTVARADLVDSGDWAANEHINSLTGENLGFQLQGWNAGLFGLVWFGLQHPDFQL